MKIEVNVGKDSIVLPNDEVVYISYEQYGVKYEYIGIIYFNDINYIFSRINKEESWKVVHSFGKINELNYLKAEYKVVKEINIVV